MILYLSNGNGDMIHCQSIDSIAQIDSKWRHKGRFFRNIDKRLFIKNKGTSSTFLGNWSRKISDYDIIIIEALQANKLLVEYIKKNAKPDTRVILWHWNKLFSQAIAVDDPICIGCELWSFDLDDCEKYGMHYNTQYYDSKNCVSYPYRILHDVWFVGADKGRLKKLKEIAEIFEQHGVDYDFHITRSKESVSDYPYKKSIPYKCNLEHLAMSKAVLDIPLAGQRGLTLRPLEALFHHKKLITSDRSITQYEFYSPQNIFVIDLDDWEGLRDFLNSPFETSIQNKLNDYEISSWIKRFEKKDEI